MSNLVITKGYADGAVLTKSLLDTSFNDVSTWLNSRDNASDSWLNVKITGSTSSDVNLLSVNGSGATTTVIINNTATDGDPKLSFQLSGSEKHAIYTDDSDSDALKHDTSAGTVWEVLAAGKIFFMDASVSGGISFIGQSTVRVMCPSSAALRMTASTAQLDLIAGAFTGKIASGGEIDLGASTQYWANTFTEILALKDGVTAPGTVSGVAQMYVDVSDGDLKIKFGDGTVKTIVVDS